MHLNLLKDMDPLHSVLYQKDGPVEAQIRR